MHFNNKVVNIWMSHLERIVSEIERAVDKKPSAVRLPGSLTPLDTAPSLGM